MAPFDHAARRERLGLRAATSVARRNRRPRSIVVSEVAGTIGTPERDRALAASAGLTEAPTVEATPLGVGVAREDTRTRSRIDLRLVVAIAAVWLLWGSTFAGMRVTV